MKTNLKPLLGLLLLIAFFSPLKGQEWVADTIIVHYQCSDSLTKSFGLSEVADLRNVEPRFISVYEKKKWLFFPVDQIVHTHLPLSQGLLDAFPNEKSGVYGLDVHQFYISYSESFFKRQLNLFSTLTISTENGQSSSPTGTFYYEHSFEQKKKEPLTDAYEQLLFEWQKRFVSDMLSVGEGLDELVPGSMYHFRRGKPAVKRNFYVETEVFAGARFWGADAALWFSEPEGMRSFTRQLGVLRYVEHPTFRAIAIGRNVRMWHYRITQNWVFTNKVAMLMGFNNWKDMDTVAHKFEEVLYLNLSFSQGIKYNRFDKTGLVFGMGVMQDMHYVIYHKPKLKIGATMNIAYKF
jgi:hypothetical protein